MSNIFEQIFRSRFQETQSQKRTETTGNLNLKNCVKITDLVVEDILMSWLLSLNNYGLLESD